MTTSALIPTTTNTTDLSTPARETGANENDPSIPSAAYVRMQPRWTKCRACFIGTEAIRAGGTDFLPQFPGEEDDEYDVRSVLVAFYNGYARTVLASVGMLLEEEPTFSEDMPQELVDLWENIDAAGTHGAVFTRRLATDGIVDGLGGILVEMPRNPKPGGLSGDEEKQLGLRPYFLHFRVDDVIKALYAKINGVRTLVLLILREIVNERVGLFGIRTVTQYRIWMNEAGVITAQVWRSSDGTGRGAKRSEGPFTILNQTTIPWSPFVAGEEIAAGEVKPPLLDLADLNIQYHMSLTNHLSLQSLAYVPTPVRVGALPNDDGEYPVVVLGPRRTIEAPVTQGVTTPIYWLSPPVDVLDAGERTLTATKADMATLGAAFLSAETRAAETAESKRIDSAASRATLATVRRALQDCLELAFDFAGNYMQLEAGSVTLNDDFTGQPVDASYLAVLVNAYQQDVITLEELRYVIQTGQLPEDFDASDAAIILELTAQSAAREEAARQLAERTQNANGTEPPKPPASEAAA